MIQRKHVATLRVLIGLLGAVAWTAACTGGSAPTSPAASAVVAPTALTAPGIEGAVMRAVSRCRGPVLDVLRTIFGNSPLVVISDDGSTLTFGVSSPGHTSSHVITYVDNDGSGSLTCGDTVTSVS